MRPAMATAVELGSDTFWPTIDNAMANGIADFQAAAAALSPGAAVERLGRAIRHLLLAVLVDRAATPDQLAEELRARISDARAASAQAPAHLRAA